MRSCHIRALLLLAGCRGPEAPPPSSASEPVTPALLGIWTVVSHTMPGISAMNDEDARRWYGLSIRLTPAEAVSRSDRCATPQYRTTADTLDVSCGQASWTAFGARMMAVGPDRARALWDGVLFELVRDKDFTALGQEPGWRLVIEKGKELRLLYAYGEKHLMTPAVPGTRDSTGAVTYHAVTESADLRVVITPVSCADAMSGKPYPATVTLTLNGQSWQGCGE